MLIFAVANSLVTCVDYDVTFLTVLIVRHSGNN